MPHEIPKPLNLTLASSPKETLRRMLEATENRDTKFPSPLDEIDPMSLDELNSRIDSGALALGQVPDPRDIERLIDYFWKQKDEFNFEIQMGMSQRGKRKNTQNTQNAQNTQTQTPSPIRSIAELLKAGLERKSEVQSSEENDLIK